MPTLSRHHPTSHCGFAPAISSACVAKAVSRGPAFLKGRQANHFVSTLCALQALSLTEFLSEFDCEGRAKTLNPYNLIAASRTGGQHVAPRAGALVDCQ